MEVTLFNKGMTRDISINIPDKEHAFENWNIRIAPVTDRSTLMSVSNEKGPKRYSVEKLVKVYNEEAGEWTVESTGEEFVITGEVIGYSVLNRYLVLFSHTNSTDLIYRLEYIPASGDNGPSWKGLELFSGDLNFSVESPIETLAYYESEDIQKVYWTDGLNSPRMMNICNYAMSEKTPDQFDFVTVFNPSLTCDIERMDSGQGSFSASVVQYFITYYNKYGQETNIVYRSSLYYASDPERGTAPDTGCTCAFKISLNNLDRNFDYVKIYSVIRTSLNTTPQAYVVGSINIVDSKAEIIDTGVYSESIDPTVLLFIGGREITAGTITQKDNTMFLGDLTLKYNIRDSFISDRLNELRDPSTGMMPEDILKFEYSDSVGESYTKYGIPYYPNNSFYPYETQLSYPSLRIKTFKGGEKYRIGVAFYTNTGASTQVYWIGDLINDKYPRFHPESQTFSRAVVVFNMPSNLLSYVKSHYSQAVLFMAEASDTDRAIKAQGVLSPTMFQMKERYSNSPFTVSSWCFRPVNGIKAFSNFEAVHPTVDGITANRDEDTGAITGINIPSSGAPNKGAEFQHINEVGDPWGDFLNTDDEGETETLCRYYIKSFKKKVGAREKGSFDIIAIFYNGKGETRDFTDMGPIRDYASEAIAWCKQELTKIGIPEPQQPTDDQLNTLRDETLRGEVKYMGNNGNIYSDIPSENLWFVANLSPTSLGAKRSHLAKYGYNYYVDSSAVTFHSPDIDADTSMSVSNLKFRVIGFIPITSVLSSYDVNITPDSKGTSIISTENFSSDANDESQDGLCAFPLVQADALSSDFQTALWTYPWHKTGSMSMKEKPNAADIEDGDKEYSVLQSKTIANLFYAYNTFYDFTGDNAWVPNISSPVLIQNLENGIYTYTQDSVQRLYQSDYDILIPIPEGQKYIVLNTGNSSLANDKELLEQGVFVQDKSTQAPYEGIQTPIQVSFKSSPHVLIPINSVEHNGSMWVAGLPELSNSYTPPTYDTFDGTFIWVDSQYSTLNTLNIMTMNSSSSFLQISEIVDETHIVVEDDYSAWEGIPGNGTRYAAINTSSGVQLIEIERITKEREPLSTPVIDGTRTSLDIETKTFSWMFSQITDADSYTLTLRLKADSSQVWTSDETEVTGSVIIDSLTENTEYVFEVIAHDSTGEWLDSAAAQVDINSGTSGETTRALMAKEPEPRAISRITIEYSPYTIPSGNNSDIFLRDTRFGSSYIYDVSDNNIIGAAPDQVRIFNESLVSSNYDSDHACLLIGELYRDFTGSEYGGTTEYSIENNVFIPIGENISLSSLQEGDAAMMIGSEGDTFFQRWDCVKTEPYSKDKENNVVEMVSFMVETHTNLDGRYDSRRGLFDNTMTTQDNINHINPVYSQNNNFITGQALDEQFDLTSFPSQITWTKTKTPTEEIDTWTNITLASTLDMDGDKGPVRALRRFGNTIYSFQDKGIAEVLFNTRTQMATTEGVPVELANSGKVDGKRYITDKAGCVNKWSVIETASGIYFIDNINSSISRLSGNGMESLSNVKGFKSWMASKNSMNIWNPSEYGNFISWYDRANDDVYFMSKDYSLCFNEFLNEFTSFYDYSSLLVLVTVEDGFFTVKDGSIWGMHEGEYNDFFGEKKPYSILYRVAPDSISDKIFTNLEYRSDMFDVTQESEGMDLNEGLMVNETFDHLDVWTEYQKASVDITFPVKDFYPDVRRKFRIWRMDIPRAEKDKNNPFGLNRIRNPWIYLKLTRSNVENNYRMQMYDLQVKFY